MEEKKKNLSDDCLGRKVADWMRVLVRVTEGHGKCHSKCHSATNVRKRGTLEMLVFHLNLCPDIDSTLVGVFNIYSIWIIVKLCK